MGLIISIFIIKLNSLKSFVLWVMRTENEEQCKGEMAEQRAGQAGNLQFLPDKINT